MIKYKLFISLLHSATMNKHGKRPSNSGTTSGSTQKRGYVTWTPQMDAILTFVLIEQIIRGTKVMVISSLKLIK